LLKLTVLLTLTAPPAVMSVLLARNDVLETMSRIVQIVTLMPAWIGAIMNIVPMDVPAVLVLGRLAVVITIQDAPVGIHNIPIIIMSAALPIVLGLVIVVAVGAIHGVVILQLMGV